MPKRHSEKEQQLLDKAREYMPGGHLGNVDLGLVIREGRGSRVWDESGNEYIDFMLGSGPMLLGHGHPEVVAAVRDQLDRGTTFLATNEHSIRLAEEIAKAVPCADKVRFCSTGTEATLYAMRAARAFRKRDKILKSALGFHGMNDYALMSMAPVEPGDFPEPVPDSAGIPRSVESEMLIAPFNDLETTTAIIERHHEDLAGVIVEPFQRVIPPKPGFLEGLREVTKQYEIPLIFDEVVTSFRFAYGGAQEFYGVEPDLCSLGKAVAGGFPLTAVAGRGEIMNNFDGGSVDREDFMPQIGTLSGNPIGAVAGLATLEVLRREGTYERLFDTGSQIKDGLQRLLDEAELPAQVIGEGPLFGAYFCDHEIVDYRSTLTADRELARRLERLLLDRGILKGEVKYYMSTAHGPDEVERTLEACASAIQELVDSPMTDLE